MEEEQMLQPKCFNASWEAKLLFAVVRQRQSGGRLGGSSTNFLVLLKNFYQQAWPCHMPYAACRMPCSPGMSAKVSPGKCFRFKWSEVNLMVSRHLCPGNWETVCTAGGASKAGLPPLVAPPPPHPVPCQVEWVFARICLGARSS